MRELHSEPISPVLAGVLVTSSALMIWADHVPEQLRVLLVVPYLLLAPGYAALPFFGPEHRLFHGLLALSLGIALAIGVSTAMSETGWWHVEVAVTGTVVLVVSCVLYRLWRDRVFVAAGVGGAR